MDRVRSTRQSIDGILPPSRQGPRPIAPYPPTETSVSSLNLVVKETVEFRRPGWALAEDSEKTVPELPRPTIIETEQPVNKPRRIHKFRSALFEAVQYPFIAAVALAAAYSPNYGQWIILAYCIIVVILRKSSRLSFSFALFMLLTIPLFQALAQPGIAQNSALYTYELLAFGIVQAMVELFIREIHHKKAIKG